MATGYSMHIEHINISAPAELLEKVKEFYCLVFNLAEGFRPSFTRNDYWLYAENNPLVHLTESLVHYHNANQGYLDHVTFQTAGLKEMVVKLETLGGKYVTDQLDEIGMTQLFFNDPTGIRLEANFIDEFF